MRGGSREATLMTTMGRFGDGAPATAPRDWSGPDESPRSPRQWVLEPRARMTSPDTHFPERISPNVPKRLIWGIGSITHLQKFFRAVDRRRLIARKPLSQAGAERRRGSGTATTGRREVASAGLSVCVDGRKYDATARGEREGMPSDSPARDSWRSFSQTSPENRLRFGKSGTISDTPRFAPDAAQRRGRHSTAAGDVDVKKGPQ